MRAIKGFILVCFLGGTVSSCFDPPEFSNSPEITLNRLSFQITTDFSDADTLLLALDFRDGNGNLGISGSDLVFSSNPYHLQNFFSKLGTNGLQSIPNEKGIVVNSGNIPIDTIDVLDFPPGSGELVRFSTRKDPGYSYLPAYQVSCPSYSIQQVLIPETAGIVDASYNVVDTLFDEDVLVLSESLDAPRYFVVADTFYVQANLDHYNIRIRFQQKIGSAYTEFKWEEEFCTTFNGRFPVLSDSERPLEGTLKYRMYSTGLIPVMGVNTWALDVIVSDRSLLSDSLRTFDFKLSDLPSN